MKKTPYFGALLDDKTLMPSAGVLVGKTAFSQWVKNPLLRRQRADRNIRCRLYWVDEHQRSRSAAAFRFSITYLAGEFTSGLALVVYAYLYDYMREKGVMNVIAGWQDARANADGLGR